MGGYVLYLMYQQLKSNLIVVQYSIYYINLAVKRRGYER